ncbi:MBL fold metallo-hydrolase [Candidimonas sp. SYP-B2681]|uniref:MBL fold metallo-hydrolase n=1 Tax=Candidimonas sp. SYP-B2681 TaxID=2497686 RepID=UPI000F863374|nr:MBL fold metallo-hydrolase [Candidimonas sp. SYP-B2681]RTZ42422.1 MBL fold metallo-hydrolase [Candidimonas sp. SYP-B2681]
MPFLLLVLILCGASSLMPASATESRVPPMQELAPGVYAIIGENAEAAPENHGAVGNQGVLIGDDGVILIDTGTSARYAAEQLDALKRLTPKPVVLAINTHQSPAFVFGNGTLALQGVPILAHRDVADLIRQRCERCLKKLNEVLGAQEMAGTTVTVPDRLIEGAMVITVAGRQLDIVYFGHTSSPGSIGIIDRASGVLFAGGLVSIGRIPDVKDARIDNWLDALDKLKARKPRLLVPGEGPVSAPSQVDDLAGYLRALQSSVIGVYKGGAGLGEAAKLSRLPQFERWPLYDPLHNKNVEQLYLQLEREALQ